MSNMEKTMAIPDNMITYLNQITPFHNTYIPPKVSTKEANGSKIRKYVNLSEILVIYNKDPKTKTKGINPQLLTASQIFEIIDEAPKPIVYFDFLALH